MAFQDPEGFGSVKRVCGLVAGAESDRQRRVGGELRIVFRLFAAVEVMTLRGLENSTVATVCAQAHSLEGCLDVFLAHAEVV